MRIITGKYKGRHFDIPRTFKARPTTDFAKENIFNVLTQYIDFEDSTALDLFSGTGSITLELISRGCAHVISVEQDRDHHRFIQQCLQKLGTDVCVPLRGDVFRFVKSCKQQFDFIFADPPYALGELPTIPSLILNPRSTLNPRSILPLEGKPSSHHLLPLEGGEPEGGLLKPGGIFVFEHGKDNDFSDDPHFVEHRSYGSVNFSIFRASE